MMLSFSSRVKFCNHSVPLTNLRVIDPYLAETLQIQPLFLLTAFNQFFTWAHSILPIIDTKKHNFYPNFGTKIRIIYPNFVQW